MAEDLKSRLQKKAKTGNGAPSGDPYGQPAEADAVHAVTDAGSEEEAAAPARKPVVKGGNGASKGGKGDKKCPVTRTQFEENATGLRIKVGDKEVFADVKQFASGGFGWFCNEKIVIEVDGQPVRVQCNMNLSVIGSKELPMSE